MLIRLVLLSLLALASAGCAGMQPINARAPRANQPPYPPVISETSQRIDAANSAWAQLTSQQGVSTKSQIELQPITATIRSLPPNVSGAIYLPKVGAAAVMNDEERHESVRRFLNEWKGLLGVDPAQL